MSSRTIGAVIRLDGEKEYRAQLRQCTEEMKTHRSEMNLAVSEYRHAANSMEALQKKGSILDKMYSTQQQKVDSLRGALEAAIRARDNEVKALVELEQQYKAARQEANNYKKTLGEESEEYKRAEEKAKDLRLQLEKHQVAYNNAEKDIAKYNRQLNQAQVELNNLSDRQEETSRLMDEARGATDGCAKSIDKYGNATKEASEDTNDAANSVDALADAIVASGVQEKVEDLAAGMMECSRAAQEFEMGIKKVSTLSDETVLSNEEMHKGILELSTDLRAGADTIADAAYEALSAGVDTRNVLDFTRQAAQLAKAGFTDTATSVDVLTTVQNAYKLSAEETELIASKLVMTQDLGKISVDQLGKVMGRVIPSAAAYKVNLDNIATSYALMTASGINAENTTTYLSTMMDELADSGSDVAAILEEETGRTFAELMESGHSLGDVLAVLGDSVENDAVQFSNLWSSATAGRGALALYNSGAQEFNRTMNIMANSSGAVARNYEILADSSDYASRRVEVATQNLQIAVGTQLNPALDVLREAGGGILEMAADVVEQNPALVAGISGVVTALGFLSGALGITGAIKALTAASAALNLTWTANPALWIAAGLVAVGTAVAVLVADTQDAQEEIDALTESARYLTETVSSTSYEDSVASAEAASETVGKYIDRLAELEQQGLDTQESQIEYQMTLDAINELMPGLNAELDEQTGLVRGGSAALRDQATAWKQAALQEAAYTRYADDIAALADAEYEVAKNTALRNMEEEKAEELQVRMAEIESLRNDLTERHNQLSEEYFNSISDDGAKLQEVSDQLAALNQEYDDCNTRLSESTEKQQQFQVAINAGNLAIADATPLVDAATKAYLNLGNQASDTSGNVDSSTDTIVDNTNELKQAYQELYDSARGSLGGQIGLFDDLAGKSELSMDQMIANLKSQEEAFNTYATNIQLAMKRGIDIGLVAELSDGTVQSMQLLDVLVNGTDEQISELIAVFGRVGEAKDNAAKGMADVQTAVNTSMSELKESAYKSAYEAGANVTEGLIQGIRSKKAAYSKELQAVAYAGQGAYIVANDQHSPSRKFRKLAEMDVQGLIVQYKADTPKLRAEASRLADAGYVAAIKARQAAIPSIQSLVSNSDTGQTGEQLTPLLERILEEVKAGKKIYLSDGTMVGATVDQYDAALGINQALAERGAI